MELNEFIVGYACPRPGCGAIYSEKTDHCVRCGGKETRPVYDYYKFFNLNPQYTETELKKSYKKLSLKYHPDINPKGKEAFITVSQGFQTLSDPKDRQVWENQISRIHNGQFTTASQSTSYSNGYQTSNENEGSYYSHTFSEADFENIFRTFHGMNKHEYSIYRASVISGRVAAILGALVAVVGSFLSGNPISLFSALLGAFIGRMIGRSNPQLAPFLLFITNIVAILFTIGGIMFFYYQSSIFIIAIVLFAAYIYFQNSRKWSAELSK